MSKWMNGWTLLPCYSNWGTQQHHWDRWAWVNWQKLTYSLLLAEHTCGLPSGSVVRDLPITQEKFDPWVRKIPWRRKWQPTSVLLPGKFHGQRSLAGYSPWDHKESNPTSRHRTRHTGNLSWPIISLAWLAMPLWLASGKLLNFSLVLCLFLQLGNENTDWSSSSEPRWS